MFSTNKLVAGIAVAFMLTAVGSANATPVLDQEYTPDPNLPPVGHAAVGQNALGHVLNMGQTFTVGITGILSAIEVRVAKNTAIIEDLTLDLRTTNGALPGPAGAILATASLSAGDIPDTLFSFISFDLSDAEINVAAGDFLSFVLSSTAQQGRMDAYRISNSGAEGGYDGGIGYSARGNGTLFTPTNDLMFRSFVDVQVSEPGAIIPLIAGLAVIGLVRQRRTRQ